MSKTVFFKKRFICRKTLCRKYFLSFIQKYDNLSNSCEKNIKNLQTGFDKKELILVFQWKKEVLKKQRVACGIRARDP